VPPGHRSATLHEKALPRRRTAQLPELPPVQLQDPRRLRPAPALQQGQQRQQFRRRRRTEIQLHAHRDRVPRGGGDEVGRQVEAQHSVSQQATRRPRKCLLQGDP
jgi:hypothetical protein